MAGRFTYRAYLDAVEVFPVWGPNTQRDFERDQERLIYREKLSGGGLRFTRRDFKKIWAKDLDHEFTLQWERYNDTLEDWEEYMPPLKFYKTDCVFDEEKQIVDVNAEVLDRYQLLLDSADREYDVIKDLMPPKHTIKYRQEGLVQVAFSHHYSVFQLYGNHWSTVEITPKSPSELEALGFRLLGDDRIYIPGDEDALDPHVGGIYERLGSDHNGEYQFERLDGAYRLRFATSPETHWQIVAWPSGTEVYAATGGTNLWLDIEGENSGERTFLGGRTFYKPGMPTVKCRIFSLFDTYQRCLTNETEVNGYASIPLPVDDILDPEESQWQYYVDPDAFPGLYLTFVPRDDHQTEPADYGQFVKNAANYAEQYFMPVTALPPPFDVYELFPVCKQSWREYGLYCYRNGLLTATQDEVPDLVKTIIETKDAYKLGEVTAALVQKIDPSITYVQNIAGSRFFFQGENPISGEPKLTHFIIPKSNILKRNYDQAATKAPIRWANLEELYRNGVNCYWWLTPGGGLQIEHVHFFKNGRSYFGQAVSEDLTTHVSPHNQRLWTYMTKKYRYAKEELPQILNFKWMDEGSDLFDGKEITIGEGFVQKGVTEERSISLFSSDIDYGQGVPGEVSLDGFYILACEMIGDEWYVQRGIWTGPGAPLEPVQNGFWSRVYLNDRFFRHNLPGPTVTINDEEGPATTVRRAKEQDITFPAPLEPDPTRLIKTSIGVGEVVSMQINLNTRAAKLKLAHDLDFDNPCPTC